MGNTFHLAARVHRLIAHVAVGCLALAMYAGMCATIAQAQCVVAGLTGSADASTTQALETIRDRRMQVAQSCPPGTMPSAGGMCVPMAGAMAPTSAQAAPKAAAPKAAAPKAGAPKAAPEAAPKAAPKAAPQQAPPAPSATYGGLKDDVVEPPRVRSYGIWAEGYGDYERRDDVRQTDGSPGSQTVKSTSWGVVSGVDHTHLRSPREGVLVGALAGYNDTHVRYSGDMAAVIPSRSRDIEGAMLGLYGSYFHRGFAIDLLAKVDVFDFDQRVASIDPGCANPIINTTSGSTDLTNYIIASNIYFRHGSGHFWLEPTAGIRYVSSDFGSRAAVLGVADGEALRLQAGVRVGSDWMGSDYRLWSVSLLAGLYSDVVVNGFNAAGGGNVVLETDEGKVRALGQLRAKVTTTHNLSYYGQAEIRGGEDYFGVAAKWGCGTTGDLAWEPECGGVRLIIAKARQA